MVTSVKPGRTRPWATSLSEARRVQERLRGTVETEDRFGEIRTVAGVDVGFEEGGRITRAAVVVLSIPDLQPVATSLTREKTRFPYVPGYLSFREAPAVMRSWERLTIRPGLLICDGHGLAHPRRFGLACHLGILMDVPSIGVAKSRLVGEHDAVPDSRGDWVPLQDGGEIVGAVVRTRTGVKPVFVSVGHRISLVTAVEWVLLCTTRYRLPETTRWADRLASGRSS